jgi:predicted dehydrogenase
MGDAIEIWDWDTVDKIKPDIAFITNPTNLHIETAIKCAERGMHLFIEKPLDCKVDYGLQHLLNLVRTKGLTSYVAYPLRFNPIVKVLKKSYSGETLELVCDTHLKDWRPYRTYSALKSRGGGVLLELSHEIDLARYLLGTIKKITGVFGRESNYLTDAETFASIVTHHTNGNTANIHLDLLSSQERRYISNSQGERFDIRVVNDQIFRDQLHHFFYNLGNKGMMNNVFDASETFKKIIEFREGE